MAWPMRFIIFIAVIIIALLGISLWWNDGISPIDQHDSTPVAFQVQKGETIRNIAARLAAERLVRSKTVFFLLLKLKGIDDKIQAGEFRINRAMSADQVADSLTHGAVDLWVTTLEGWRVEEIAAKLSQDLKIPEREFISVAEEGYMFPDTYLLPKDASASAVANIFKNNLDKRITSTMKADAAKQGLKMADVIILASLVEREGRTADDKPVIAGILRNRLLAEWPLDIDATLQYALGYQSDEKSWWKKNLTDEDKKINSPYNTYLHKGLPAGPISNPGLVSIKAVIYPIVSEYYFYIHDPSGTPHYAKTVTEHETNVNKYLR